MAVEEEGLRVFQSVRIKIGEDRGDLGSSPDPCSWYPARLDQLLVLSRPDSPVLRGTAGEAGPASGASVCVRERAWLPSCVRVRRTAPGLLWVSGARVYMHEHSRFCLDVPTLGIRSTDVSLWVSPSHLCAGTSFPRRGRPFTLSAVRCCRLRGRARATECLRAAGMVMELPAPPPPFIENWPWDLWPAGLAFRLLSVVPDFCCNAGGRE